MGEVPPWALPALHTYLIAKLLLVEIPCTCSCMVKRRLPLFRTHSRPDMRTRQAAGQNVPTKPLTNESWIWVTRETNVYHGMVTKSLGFLPFRKGKKNHINFLILSWIGLRRYSVLNSVFRQQVYWQKMRLFYRFIMKYIYIYNFILCIYKKHFLFCDDWFALP